MRILSWNIRHGAPGPRAAAILEAIARHDPDVAILAEYRTEEIRIVHELQERGWSWTYAANAPTRTNSVFVASKAQLRILPPVHAPAAGHRWVEFEPLDRKLRVLGLHIPGINDRWGKRAFWAATLKYAAENARCPAMIIGDLNTGLRTDAEGTPFTLSESFLQLLELGWVDVWRDCQPGRETEYSWYSTAGNGFRVDHALASPVLRPLIRDARYSHAERLASASDHSLLIVEVE